MRKAVQSDYQDGAYKAKDAGMLPLDSEVHSKHNTFFFPHFFFEDVKTD